MKNNIIAILYGLCSIAALTTCILIIIYDSNIKLLSIMLALALTSFFTSNYYRKKSDHKYRKILDFYGAIIILIGIIVMLGFIVVK
ncbi:hypothetical protein D0T87_15650 [Bacteroides sp. 51]|nr:hypothetical protein [Bacteroides sp. 51]